MEEVIYTDFLLEGITDKLDVLIDISEYIKGLYVLLWFFVVILFGGLVAYAIFKPIYNLIMGRW